MILTQFGNYVFPTYNKRDTVSMGDTGSALLALPGGGTWDVYQTGQSSEAITTITTAYEIIASTAAAVQTARDDVRARAGRRRRLWAKFPDGTYRFVWARLAKVKMEKRREYIFYQPVELTFEVAQPGWNGAGHGAAWLLDAGVLLDGGLYLDYSETHTLDNGGTPRVNSFTVTNGGNRTVTSVLFTFRAAGNPVSAITVACGSCSWTFSGSVAAGKIMTIDTATRSVLNDGVDAYGYFSLDAAHTVGDWMQLLEGNNTMTVTCTCAGAATTLDITYYDGWQ